MVFSVYGYVAGVVTSQAVAGHHMALVDVMGDSLYAAMFSVCEAFVW